MPNVAKNEPDDVYRVVGTRVCVCVPAGVPRTRRETKNKNDDTNTNRENGVGRTLSLYPGGELATAVKARDRNAIIRQVCRASDYTRRRVQNRKAFPEI